MELHWLILSNRRGLLLQMRLVWYLNIVFYDFAFDNFESIETNSHWPGIGIRPEWSEGIAIHSPLAETRNLFWVEKLCLLSFHTRQNSHLIPHFWFSNFGQKAPVVRGWQRFMHSGWILICSLCEKSLDTFSICGVIRNVKCCLLGYHRNFRFVFGLDLRATQTWNANFYVAFCVSGAKGVHCKRKIWWQVVSKHATQVMIWPQVCVFCFLRSQKCFTLNNESITNWEIRFQCRIWGHSFQWCYLIILLGNKLHLCNENVLLVFAILFDACKITTTAFETSS